MMFVCAWSKQHCCDTSVRFLASICLAMSETMDVDSDVPRISLAEYESGVKCRWCKRNSDEAEFLTYQVVVTGAEDGDFVAQYSDVESCNACCDTIEEILGFLGTLKTSQTGPIRRAISDFL